MNNKPPQKNWIALIPKVKPPVDSPMPPVVSQVDSMPPEEISRLASTPTMRIPTARLHNLLALVPKIKPATSSTASNLANEPSTSGEASMRSIPLPSSSSSSWTSRSTSTSSAQTNKMIASNTKRSMPAKSMPAKKAKPANLTSSASNVSTSKTASKSKLPQSSEAPPAKKAKLLTSDVLPFHLFSQVKEKKRDKLKEFYTIQTGLRSIMREQFRADLLEMIEDDVLVVSTVMSEFSLYFNFICRERLGAHIREIIIPLEVANYFTSIDTTILRNVMFSIQGKTGRTYLPLNAQYAAWRHQYGLEQSYNCNYRAGLFQECIKEYETSLKNNIIVHMRRRLLRYFFKVPDAAGEVMRVKREVIALVADIITNATTVNERLGISLGDLKAKPFKYIPLLFRIQQELTAIGEKSFRVIPLNKMKMRHVTYTDTAFCELMTRYSERMGKKLTAVERLQLPRNARVMWDKYFDFSKYEQYDEDGIEIKSFYHLLTDGVKASILMQRQMKEVEQNPVNVSKNSRTKHLVEIYGITEGKPVPDFDYIMGIDPGFRLTLGGIRYNVATGAYDFIKEKSRKLHHNSGKNVRKMKMERWSKVVEERVRDERERLNEELEANNHIGPTSADFAGFTRFELEFFTRRINLFAQPKFRRLNFDSIIRRRSNIDNMISSLCPRNASTLLFYGSTKFASFIKGYIKSPHTELYDSFKRLPRCTVLAVDEYRTTRCCSGCFQICPPRRAPDRDQRCNDCNITWNRDVNAGRNIIVRGLATYYSFLGFKMPINLQRGNNTSTFQVLDYDEDDDSDYLPDDNSDIDSLDGDEEGEVEIDMDGVDDFDDY